MKRGVETVKSIEYTAGRRVATVEQVVSRADDCEEMGNLYFRLSDLYRRLDNLEDGMDNERAALIGDIADVRSRIAEYEGYLRGYTD